MNPGEMYEAQVALIEVMNNLWEIWLGGTFAVIVAFHVGRTSVTKPLLWIGCFLYVAACVSILMRYVAYISMFGEVNQMLSDSGIPMYPMPEWFAVPNAMLTFSVFLIGSISTVYFATHQYKRRDA